ncbi:2-oxoacid ferredoxin oxidoreductase [Alkalibaculum sp. M08DMB]|uniref:2-oxoacid ferredoxin oxidoreductase n=1 Tax=Alkalibaculum sporogenes TaxID=2655001 RepID=A0A6A7K8T9_9FIRM|nr:thiamine pyrophosphate-dependent enzyme [Alkalibaculum sporogenes]MPW25888.1 2-oxoacid ferredoxin oxidoreductase [Alkalibaculum sporogenes]
MKKFDFDYPIDIAWCPGCGNFSIRDTLIDALQELDINQTDVVFSSGIGQAAKMPQYINASYFNGLHGRALPVAVAIKATNPNLTVIAEGGDGDMYGEGGNHFIHNIRRNSDITHLVHNNMVYGLTKGQASPTSKKDFTTPVQVSGVTNEPFNPLSVALTLGATFVARTFSDEKELTKEIIKQAINHKGYALVDILHPCVSFNKINNFAWYKNNTYILEENYDNSNLMDSMKVAMDTEKMALGIIYKGKEQLTFEKQLAVYQNNLTPISFRKRDLTSVNELID